MHQLTFPTRTIQQKEVRPYYLLLNQPARQHRTLEHVEPNTNIFKNGEIFNQIEDEQKRPVGGIQLIKRFKQKDRESSKKGPRGRIFIDDIIRNRNRRTKTEMGDHYQKRNRQYSTLETIGPHEQTFKQDKIKCSIKKANKSQIKFTHHRLFNDETSRQRKSYMDKRAILDEIESNQSLIQQCGDKYFEYMLRDRWKEEIRPPHFIYQLKKGEEFTKNKVLKRIKELHPEIKQRRQLLLKGKNLSKI